MLNKKMLEITVGFFMLAGLAALLMLAITVSGLTGVYSQNKGYLITADFNNVGGLKPRAKVSIAGVPVGRVVGIALDQKNFLAKVTILVNDDWHQIPSDSQASILTAGLLGDNYIGITAGFSDVFWKEGAHVGVEETNSAIVLEQLISKFMSNQASSGKKS